MKTVHKMLLCAAALIFVMLVLPWAVIQLFPDWAGVGLWVCCFFVLNPLAVIGASVLAGTALRQLWWMPLAAAAVFPLLFGVVVGEFVWELYIYSAIYLTLGVLAMLGTHFGIKRHG